jgi:hypothetical protein
MTGQVKEEILTRMGELGAHVRNGEIHFEPTLLKISEFFAEPHVFRYYGIDGSPEAWELGPDTLAFTLCQVPVCYELSERASITVERRDGGLAEFDRSFLAPDVSSGIFRREDVIRRLRVRIPRDRIHP